MRTIFTNCFMHLWQQCSSIAHCIVFINLYSAAHSSDHSVALPLSASARIENRRKFWVGRNPERMVTGREERSLGRAFNREVPMNRGQADRRQFMYMLNCCTSKYITLLMFALSYIWACYFSLVGVLLWATQAHDTGLVWRRPDARMDVYANRHTALWSKWRILCT